MRSVGSVNRCVGTRISLEDLAWLNRKSKEDGVNVSHIIRDAICFYRLSFGDASQLTNEEIEWVVANTKIAMTTPRVKKNRKRTSFGFSKIIRMFKS